MFPTYRWIFPTAKLRFSAQRDHEFSTSSFAEALKGEEIISQWFDVWDIKTPEQKEELMIPGLSESIQQILDIIEDEAQKVPLERIILGGISQGCATAILALLSSGKKLGGFIGLCSWLPFKVQIESLPVGSKRDTENISLHIRTILKMGAKRSDFDLDVRKIADETHTDEDKLQTGFNNFSIQPDAKTPIFLSHSKDDDTVPFAMGADLHKGMLSLDADVTWKEYEDGGHWIHPREGVDDISAFLRGLTLN